MIVKELIEKLEEFNPELEVRIQDFDGEKLAIYDVAEAKIELENEEGTYLEPIILIS